MAISSCLAQRSSLPRRLGSRLSSSLPGDGLPDAAGALLGHLRLADDGQTSSAIERGEAVGSLSIGLAVGTHPEGRQHKADQLLAAPGVGDAVFGWNDSRQRVEV